MGRKENIKRAKRLKKQKMEAGRKKLRQERNMLAFWEKNKSEGYRIELNNGPVKYSDLLIEFIQPELEDGDDEQSLKAKLGMAVLSWNLGVLKKNAPEKYAATQNELDEVGKEHGFQVAMLENFIERKINDYPEENFLIRDFSLMGTGKNFHVSVIGEKV